MLSAGDRKAVSLATRSDDPPLHGRDVEFPPPFWPDILAAEAAISVAYGAGYYDVSEYMIGSVTVGLILPESNGAIDPSTEDWTPQEQQKVYDEVVEGTTWWTAREPSANISFTYEVHNSVPTSYEPIIHKHGNPYYGGEEHLWMTEVMSALGFPPHSGQQGYVLAVYDFANDLRTRYGTDWAVVIFVVDSSNDADGKFTDGWRGYARFGGPHFVMTYDSGEYGIENMGGVAAHEMAHIFYTLDEYIEVEQPCTETSGYLNVPNQNSEYGACLLDEPCIMRDILGPSWNGGPYSNGIVCPYSRGQIGQRDSDGDGILDIVDTLPNSVLNEYLPDPSDTWTPTYTGTAQVVPYPNSNPYPWGDRPRNDISVNTIASVQYRVNGGSWKSTIPADGAFDEAEESFTFTPLLLWAGTYLIETRAINSVGNAETSYGSDTLIISSDWIPSDFVFLPLVLKEGSVD